MASIYDVDANVLIEKAAKELAKSESIKAPDWAAFVKTSPSKERVPVREDWWYVRAAAILRTFYQSKGPLGVQKLRLKYGSKKNRGHKPERFYRASGKIIRLLIQQLEKDELLKQADIGVHKGRVIAPKGKSLLDKTASIIIGKRPKAETPKVEKAPDKKAEVKIEKKEKKVVKKAKKKETVSTKEDKKPEEVEQKAKDVKADEDKIIAEASETKSEPKSQDNKEDKASETKSEPKSQDNKEDKVEKSEKQNTEKKKTEAEPDLKEQPKEAPKNDS